MNRKKNTLQTKSAQRKAVKTSAPTHGELVAAIGLSFLNSPYRAGLLEAGSKERLIVDFRSFDCSTFIETVIALARCVQFNNDLSDKNFRRELQFIRYRGGIIAGYASRLHYFSDWLYDNSKKGIIRDISRQIGAKEKTKVINFMTSHLSNYPALGDKKVFQSMQNIERKISRRKMHVLPVSGLADAQAKIRTGDIIAFASKREGLDVGHVGFALWLGERLHLLHASSRVKGVVISAKPLLAYLKQNSQFTGIIAARVR
jgi:hypothetical protein